MRVPRWRTDAWLDLTRKRDSDEEYAYLSVCVCAEDVRRRDHTRRVFERVSELHVLRDL